MEDYLQEIVRLSLGSSPEEMLKKSLEMCIELAGASGGSILGEEGPSLQFLFADIPDLIGVRVPIDSIAGVTVTQGKVVYTYAPKDKRHFSGVDDKIQHTTRYLLSIPIPSIHRAAEPDREVVKHAGALQLLFEHDMFPSIDVVAGPREFDVEAFKAKGLPRREWEILFWILPIVAFGIEVMHLRQTSYQAIHELKNKLISGQSWLDYLKEDLVQVDATLLQRADIQEDFELATSSIREGAELARKYLQLTKLYTPDFQDEPFNQILRETAASARALSRELGAVQVQVEIDLDEQIGTRSVDAGQVKMALFNLCKNAIEVLAQVRSSDGVLRLSSHMSGDRVTVVIDDNGPGMPPEIRDHLFMAFKTKKEGGTGLGLTIAKKIIDVHGGSVTCSTSEQGTRFTVVL